MSYQMIIIQELEIRAYFLIRFTLITFGGNILVSAGTSFQISEKIYGENIF